MTKKLLLGSCFLMCCLGCPLPNVSFAHSAAGSGNMDERVPVDGEEDFADLDGKEWSAPLNQEEPAETVEQLSARANDWREPSRGSEREYVIAMRRWLSALDPGRRERARQILRDSHPGLRALRMAIREKKSQLASLSFDRDTKPETLPRLGKELQDLRSTLRKSLQRVNERLRHEAGVVLQPVGEHGLWLMPPNLSARRPHSATTPPLAAMPEKVM